MNAFATATVYGDLKAVGVDEISYCKGHKYATIVYDLKKACVVWVGKGKGEKRPSTVFLTKCLVLTKNNKIKWATCDMSQAYINSIENHCPNVTLVLDRFHIVKKLNEAVDKVRKDSSGKKLLPMTVKPLKVSDGCCINIHLNARRNDTHRYSMLFVKATAEFIAHGS